MGSPPPRDPDPLRRVGDTVAIAGDYQYRALTRGPAVQRFWHDTKLWLVHRYLQPGPDDRVLDVGCGSGVVAAALSDVPVRHSLGVDGNPDAVAFASRQFRRPNLEYRLGLVDELDLPSASFDAVCCMELIEHITEPQGRVLLESLHRLVRPGGRLLLTTPNYRSAWPAIEWLLDRSGRVPKLAGDQHVAFYTHRRLAAVAQAAGWTTLVRHTCCTAAPWAAAVSWRLAERLRRAEAALPFGTLLVHVLERPAPAASSAARRAA